MKSWIALAVAVIGVMLTFVSVLFGPGILDRFSPKLLTYETTQSSLRMPSGMTIHSDHANRTIPDSILTFTLMNQTSVTCNNPLFGLTLPGPIVETYVSETTESKDAIKTKYEQTRLGSDSDIVKFELPRLAPGSFMKGIVWYLASGSKPVQATLSSEGTFRLRKSGEEEGSKRERILAFLASLATVMTMVSAGLFLFWRDLRP